MLKHNKKSNFLKSCLIVLCIYVLLTIVLTYPWITKFTTYKLGDDIDGSMLIWNIWWIKKAFSSLGCSLLFSDYIFYPIGTSLVFHTLTLLNGIIALPFFLITKNIILIYNILTFSAFVLSGFGVYLLVDYLVKDKIAAFTSGLIFTFCPFHFVKVSFINYLSTQWIPFYILFLLKSFNEERSKYLNIFFASLFLLFNTLICEIYGLFAVLFTLSYLAYCLITEKNYSLRKRVVLRCFAVFFFFLLLFSPLLYSMGKFLLEEGGGILSSTFENAKFESVDLLGYITPNPLHPIWGDFFFNLTRNFSGIFQETTIFPGYIVILLTLYSFIKIKNYPILKFWVLMLLISILLTFGPTLHINGKEQFSSLQVTIPMPYLITYYLPFLKAVRIPGRYGVMVMLFFAILAGYSSKMLFARKTKNLNLLQIVIIGFIIFEYFSIPFPLISDMKIPGVYKGIKNSPGDFTILHIPLGWRAKGTYHIGYNFTRFQYYQTFHAKRILDGMLARTLMENTDYFAKAPIVKSLVSLEYGNSLNPEAIQKDKENIKEFLEFFNIKYIIIDEIYERVFTHISKDSLGNIDNYIKEVFPVELVFQNNSENRTKIDNAFREYKEFLEKKSPPREDPFYNEITSLDTTFKVYRVNMDKTFDGIKIYPKEEISNLYLANGWSEISENNPVIQAIKSKPLILVRFNNTDKKEIRFKASPLKPFEGGGFGLVIKLNNYKTEEILIKPGWNIYSVNLPEGLQKNGINRIEFLRADSHSEGNIPINFEFFEIEPT